MANLNNPGSSASRRQRPRWRSIRYVGGSYRIPLPPGPPPEPGKAQREEEARARARGEAQVARLHLVGLFKLGVIVMGAALAAVLVLAVLAVMGRH
ncbi:MAG TPA: hypothetical protein VEL03_12560 [Streptosporangiaceae bacterium]|nr:hypothetical protein [Streptosporangiaceae bacterium]